MSRIGKKPIDLGDKVKVNVQGKQVNVEGPLGKLSYSLPDAMSAAVKDGKLTVEAAGAGDSAFINALHGTTRARLQNLVSGVATGFSKVLEIQGLGFKAQVAGTKLNMELGFSHPVILDIPPGIKIEVDPKQTVITVKGIDKVLVGDIAAKIKRFKKTEPYKGTGIRYQGEYVARKAGKAAAATAKK